MKYIVVLGDGMADLPLKELNEKTPLEAANTRWMDFIAKEGKNGLLKTLDKEMPLGSEVANLSILGYEPRKYYPGGRGPLEAPALGIKLKEGEIAARCNFITFERGIMKHYSAGDISTEESRELILELNRKLGSENISFYPGEGYRAVIVLKNSEIYSEKVKCIPPHEMKMQPIEGNFSQPLEKNAERTSKLLNKLSLSSEKILSEHWVNKKRKKEGKAVANMIWFWGIGKYIPLPKFKEKFNLSGALISGVTLLKGMGKAIGLEVINVPGSSANFETDYERKADYALKALKEKDFVYVHIKAPDDMSHKGDVEKKIKAIEKIDKEVVGRILENLKRDFKIAVLPDHVTLTKTGEHTPEPVPFAIYSPSEKGDSVQEYNEKAASKGFYGLRKGIDFMKILLKKKSAN